VSIDQQFVEFVVKSLVSKPDEVKIERRIDEKGVLLELTVDPEDLGRVIGKRGATAQSIRTLLRALGTKNDARYNLKIVDNGPAQHSSGGGNNGGGLWGSDDSSSSEDEGNAEKVVADAAEQINDGNDSAAPVAVEDEKENDNLSRTRKELADLDDLDV